MIDHAIRSGWLKCCPVSNLQLAAALAGELDQGEAEAIALAIEVQAHVLLIDERDGRTVARRAGITVRGVFERRPWEPYIPWHPKLTHYVAALAFISRPPWKPKC